jgi:hypothetical protein
MRYNTADPFPTFQVFVDIVFIRSMVIIITEPILVIISSISAVSWGVIYLFIESLAVSLTALDLSQTAVLWSFLALIVGVIIDPIPHIWEVQQLKEKRKMLIPIEPED